MATIKENISTNIVQLRKKNNWTQADLAEKLNYTDKAVSKWERGESTPDVETLYQMSQLFNVSIDFFLHENEIDSLVIEKEKQNDLVSKILKLSLIIVAVWFIGTVVYVYGIINNINVDKWWLSFIWPVPASCILALILCHKYNFKKAFPYVLTGGLWSLLTAIFLQFLVFGRNFWIIFIVGIPIQVFIVLSTWLNKKIK